MSTALEGTFRSVFRYHQSTKSYRDLGSARSDELNKSYLSVTIMSTSEMTQIEPGDKVRLKLSFMLIAMLTRQGKSKAHHHIPSSPQASVSETLIDFEEGSPKRNIIMTEPQLIRCLSS